MKTFLIVLLLILLQLASPQGKGGYKSNVWTPAKETLQIESITLPNGGSTLVGSLRGGTDLFISGYGFDRSDPENNIVLVGGYHCPVKEAGRTFLVCETTNSDYTSSSTDLPIQVIVGTEETEAEETFRYYTSSTPYLSRVYPSATFGDNEIAIWGIHRVGTLSDNKKIAGDFLEIKIGENLCSRRNYGVQYISSGAYQFVRCKINEQLQTGKYDISHKVLSGYAHKHDSMKNRQNHELTILPSITKVTPPHGAGQMLKIWVTGLIEDESRVTVTVDGRVCDINKIKNDKIICRLNNQRNQSSMINTNINFDNQTQKKPYIGGAGWVHERYRYLFSSDIKNFRNIFHSGISSTKTKDTKTLELRTPSHLQYYYYSEAMYGYFKPPVSGNYTFKGFASEKFALYVSKSYGTASIDDDAEPIIWSNTETGNTSYYNTEGDHIVGNQIYMEGGQYYYMELYHTKTRFSSWYKYTDYLQIGAEIPTEDPNIEGEVFAVHNFSTHFDPDPEIMQFVQEGAESGTISLKLVRMNSNFQVTYEQQRTIAYNCSLSTFLYNLKRFSGYEEYPITGQLWVYDRFGENITDSGDYSNGTKFVWRIFIHKMRTALHLQEEFEISFNVTGQQEFYQQRVQEHSDLISGTFQIQFAGDLLSFYDTSIGQQSNDFPFSASASLVQDAFRAISPKTQEWRVQRRGDPYYSAEWFVYYDGFADSVPLPVFYASGLSGGKAGTSPYIQVDELTPFKKKIIYDFIGYEFLFQASDEPNILVTFDDDLLSVCDGQCHYEYREKTPTIEEIDIDGSELHLGIDVPENTTENITLDDLQITDVNTGERCQIVNGTDINNLTCRFPENNDSSPTLEGGILEVDVWAEGTGFLPIIEGIQKVNITTQLHVVFPPHGSSYGGYVLQLIGKGFPMNNSFIDKLEILLCHEIVQILDVSNTIITIRAPACQPGNSSVILMYKDMLSEFMFIYEDPLPEEQPVIIHQISPKSSSPVLKTHMQIFGSGFGNDSIILKVQLLSQEGGKNYPMKVLDLNDTFLKVGLSGGLQGFYKVEVIKEGFAISQADPQHANFFHYEIAIEEISPMVGSPYGGTLLTIRGRNFSPEEAENLVFIGNKPNTFCELVSYNETQIQCITPAKPDKYMYDKKQDIEITQRLIQSAQCEVAEGCSFTYDSQFDGPTLDSVNKDKFTAYEEVILTGDFVNFTYFVYHNETDSTNQTSQIINQTNSTNETNSTNQTNSPSYTEFKELYDVNNFIVVFKNTLTEKETFIEPPFLSNTSTELSFQFPEVQEGIYNIKLRNEFGDSNQLTVTLEASFSRTSFNITADGAKILLTGVGLPEEWPHSLFKTRLSRNIKYEVLYSSPTEMEIEVFEAKVPSSYLYSSFKLKGPLTKKSVSIYHYLSCSAQLSMNYQTSNPFDVPVEVSLPTWSGEVTEVRLISLSNFQTQYDIYNFTINGGKVHFSYPLLSGAFDVKIHYRTPSCGGWLYADHPIQIDSGNLTYIASEVGFEGGLLPVMGVLGEGAIIRVNDKVGEIVQKNETFTWFFVPENNLQEVSTSPVKISRNRKLGVNIVRFLKKRKYKFEYISDLGDQGEKAFDNKWRDRYSSTNSTCFAGIKLASDDLFISLKSIKIQLQKNKNLKPKDYNGIRFEGSLDGVNWELIVEYNDFHSAKSYHLKKHKGDFNENATLAYKYLRFVHDQRSQCSVNKIKWRGDIMSYSNKNIFDVTVNDGAKKTILPDAVTYLESKTPTVNNIQPKTGDYFGGYNITLTGNNLGFAEAYVQIDTIQCLVLQSNDTMIICEVQERSSDIQFIDLHVTIGGNVAILNDWFYYVMRWSDPTTWGVDSLPNDGDLVHVPEGRVLFVDQSTPDLLGIVVEGMIIFTDEEDMTIRTGFIMINNGKFWAGDEGKPYQHKLTFEMTGSYLSTKKQPIFGDKFIGCQECWFSMHGKDVGKVWTVLSVTANEGDNTIEVEDEVNWNIGDEIVIASTSFENSEAERRRIVDISNNRTILLDEPLAYTHLSLTLEGKKNLQVKAEVGLLSHNIKIMGVDNTENEEYGATVMIRGDEQETFAFMENVQLTKCGQPQLPGHACVASLVDGMTDDIQIRVNSIHDSYGRGLYVEDGYDILIEENVLYNVSGSNIWLKGSLSSVELHDNLLINPRQSWKMYQFDAMPSAIFMTGPKHTIQGNRLAGGQYSGIWYYLDYKLDGESECGWGLPIGFHSHNTIHTFKIYGVYIDKLSPRSDPCASMYTDYQLNTEEAYEAILSDFNIYRNLEKGMFVDDAGYLTITESAFAENGISVHVYYEGLAKEDSRITHSTFYGQIDPNSTMSTVMIGMPCSNSFHLHGIQFSSANPSTTAVRSCEYSSYLRTLTDEYFVSNITYTNFQGKFVDMTSIYDGREVFYNEDGTFVNQNDSVTIVTALNHFLEEPDCLEGDEPTRWPGAFICSRNVTVRKMHFYVSGHYYLRYYSSLTFRKIDSFTDTSAHPGQSFKPYIYSHSTYSQEVPFIMNRTYSFTYGASSNYDFSTLKITPSNLIKEGEGGIVFRHNYITNRELYEVFTYEEGQLSDPQTNIQNGSTLKPEQCSVGDFYHDNEKSLFGVCVSSRHLSQYQYVYSKAIYCRYLCPEPEEGSGGGCSSSVTQQAKLRKWSNDSMWPNKVRPQEGDDVTIPGQWKVLMDVQPPPLGDLTITGTLVIPSDIGDINLEVQNIWVKGKFKVGKSSSPFTNKLEIKMNGQRNDRGIVVDPKQVGNKLIVVTGTMLFYGDYPTTIWTRLVETAVAGSNYIKVDRNTGWKAGDKLVLGPSFSNPHQTEYVQISSISSNVVSLTQPLLYTHFGASSLTIYESFGEIDARTAVGHLTRNIRITSGDDEQWGYRLLTYGYSQCGSPKFGTIVLSGVQLANGGQFDSEKRPTIHLSRLTQGLVQSKILQSSIHHCRSRCLILDEVNNIKINNNVFASATNFHIEFKGKKNYKVAISYNLLVDAHHNRKFNDKNLPVACIEWKEKVYKSTTTGSSIYKNLCQGSQGAGFSHYFTKCGKVNVQIFNQNNVGSAEIGYLLHYGDGHCAVGSGLTAYGCKVGVTGIAKNVRKLYYKKLLIIDSSVGVALKLARKGLNLNAYVEDSYISAIERSSCPHCYGDDATKCRNNEGIKMFVATESVPKTSKAYTASWSEAMSQTSFDSKAFIKDVTFKNYNYQYTQSQLNQCGENFIFRPPRTASELIGSHHLQNVSCLNCSSSSYVYFDDPSETYVGKSRSCGPIPCSGKLNCFIKDYDGALLGAEGSLIPNTEIGNYTDGCAFDEKMNSFLCFDEEFVVVEYESFAPDFNSRFTWPIHIHPVRNYEVSNTSNSSVQQSWETVINGNREWIYVNGKPAGRRLNRFATLLPSNDTYQFNFGSLPPRKTFFQLQKKKKDDDAPLDWVIVKFFYPLPNSLRVKVNGEIVDPITILDDHAEDPLLGLVDQCGSNKFYFKDRTLDFVLNTGCTAKVFVANSIQLTAKFQMDIKEFFDMDGKTKFIDRICALLGISDFSRVKVVGIYNGSVTVDSFIEDQHTDNETNSTNVTENQAQEMSDLNDKLTQLYATGQVQAAMTEVGLGSVVFFNHELSLIDDLPQEEEQEEDHTLTPQEINMLLIAIGGAAVALALLIIGCVCYHRRKNSIENDVLEFENSEEKRIVKRQKMAESYAIIDID